MSDTFPLKSLWQRKINHNIKKWLKLFVSFCGNKQTKKQEWGSHHRFGPRMEEWHRGAKSKKYLTPEGSWWYMLIPQDCTARCDQTIGKYFVMLRMQTMLNLPKTILAKHAENTVSIDQWRKPDIDVLWPHKCLSCTKEMCSFISPQIL